MEYLQELSKVVDGKVVVDWSKGPDDAQFYTPETDVAFEGFVKIEGDQVFCFVPSHGHVAWRLDWIADPETIEEDANMIKKEA